MSRASHLARTRRMQRSRREERSSIAVPVASAASPLPPILDTLVTAAVVIHSVGAGLAKAGKALLRRVGTRTARQP